MVQYGVRIQRSDVLKLQPNPEGPTVRTFQRWCSAQREAGRPIAVDLFCGAGGLSMGLETAGWAVAAAVDHDPYAVETHRHNFVGLSLDLDLSTASARDTFVHLFNGIPVDLVAGGPPCQPFSRAGRSKIRSLVAAGLRENHDERRELWSAFLKVALRLKPRAILMENVPDMGLSDDFKVVRIMVDELENNNYLTQVQLVDAWRFGVPQHRKRLILLARRDGYGFTWPDESGHITTLRDCIGDLPGLISTTGAREMAYVPPSDASAFSRRMRMKATPGVLHDHMTRAVRPDDLQVFQLMDSKTLYSDIPEHLRRYKADNFDDKYKRLDWGELSRSITAHIAKDGYWYIHPQEHRTLTVREAARIQTFPDNFRFSGTRSDAFRQIGNAVPPLLAEAAAKTLTARTDEPASATINWRAVRGSLTKWAQRQRSSRHWFMLPGPAVTLPVALAAAVLSNTRSNPEYIGEALKDMKGQDTLDGAVLDSANKSLAKTKAGDALNRLRPLLHHTDAWQDPQRAVQIVGLQPAEEQVFWMLQGADIMLRTQGPIRVAARVAGSRSAEVNRLTDGRIDLARLVGSGRNAALRMAALRLISVKHCTADSYDCRMCPLSASCSSARPEAVPLPSPA